jgi:hypothetical protein
MLEQYKARFESGENPITLMTELEQDYKIPMILDPNFNKNNAELMELYYKISESRGI